MAARLLIVSLALWALAGNGLAEAYRPPRTPWGAPDLQGLWTNLSLTGLERPAQFRALAIPDAEAQAFDRSRAGPPPNRAGDTVGGNETEWFDEAALARIGGQARSSWIVEPADGRLPYTPEAEARLVALLAAPADHHPEGTSLYDRCLMGLGGTSGPPMMNARYNANYQIVQTPDAVVIVAEMNHDARIIRLRDHRRPPPSVRLWMGDSIGRWEGDTLVVETTNLHPGQSLRSATPGAGRRPNILYHSPAAIVVERLTRVSPTQILYAFTVDDPATFSRPWRAEMPFNAARGPMYEYACHEGNYGLRGILAGARAQEGSPAGP
jgi:hypothetical protein